MRELRDLLDAYNLLRRNRERGLLATVVAAQGSTYRRPGARMLLLPDGRRIGTLSGGCLEREAGARAAELAAGGAPLVVRYDATGPDDAVLGLGLGCQGVIDVLLETVGPGACPHLDFAASCVGSGTPGVLATVYRSVGEQGPQAGARLMLDGSGVSGALARTPFAGPVRDEAFRLLSQAASATRGVGSQASFSMQGCTIDVLLELFIAPVRLLIFGAGPDTVPLARLARELGWHATIVHPRPALRGDPAPPDGAEVVECDPRDVASRIDLGGRAAAVLMSHDYLTDLELARALAPSTVSYLGLLGPRRRGERLLADMEKQGVGVGGERRGRIHFPAGLDIAADSPQEIALAIVAEILAALAGRSGGRLRDRDSPIHEARDPSAERRE